MKQQVVTIVGLGHIGLPTLMAVRESGKYIAYGLDTDEEHIRCISGKHPELTGFITSQPGKCLPLSRFIVICVPTTRKERNSPDLRFITEVVNTILRYRNRVIKVHLIIESTLPPLACTQYVLPLFTNEKLQPGIDFELSYCPERLNPGDGNWPLNRIPRVIASVTARGLKEAEKFYKSFITADIHPVKSLTEAELAKLTENIFRDVNIGLVNELAILCHNLNVDISGVLKASSTKPFAFLAHIPGIGVGGECIPTASFFIHNGSKKSFTPIMKAARSVNSSMPAFSVSLLKESAAELHKHLSQLTVGIAGISYKAESDDVRRSPYFSVYKHVRALTHTETFDPYVKKYSTVQSAEELLQLSDAVILVTPHRQLVDAFTGQTLKKYRVHVVIDGRNCLDKQNIEQFGIIYKGIGR